ncbi:MAG: hypothetical protein ACPGOV_06185 [Magnetovibrionaceae bacterium]
MESTDFSSDELDLFSEAAEKAPEWSNWTVRYTPEGRHVIAVTMRFAQNGALTDAFTVRLAKALPGKYMARGLPGWDLLVCDDFQQLLDIVKSGCAVREAAE